MAASQPSPHAAGDDRIVGSVDGDGSDREYVIADITEDGAWLSVEVADAPTLRDCR